jgi:hypothetical protein
VGSWGWTILGSNLPFALLSSMCIHRFRWMISKRIWSLLYMIIYV